MFNIYMAVFQHEMRMVPGSWHYTSDLCTDMLHNMQPHRHSTLCLYQWRRGDNLSRTKPKHTTCWTLILNIIIWLPARDENKIAKWIFKKIKTHSLVFGILPILSFVRPTRWTSTTYHVYFGYISYSSIFNRNAFDITFELLLLKWKRQKENNYQVGVYFHFKRWTWKHNFN